VRTWRRAAGPGPETGAWSVPAVFVH
jgi:hypothetical protein